MAKVQDILFDNDGDLAWVDGDLVWGDSDDQHVQDILTAVPGNYTIYPMVGCSILDMLNGNISNEILQRIRIQLAADGYQVDAVSYINTQLNIDCIRKIIKEPNIQI